MSKVKCPFCKQRVDEDHHLNTCIICTRKVCYDCITEHPDPHGDDGRPCWDVCKKCLTEECAQDFDVVLDTANAIRGFLIRQFFERHPNYQPYDLKKRKREIDVA